MYTILSKRTLAPRVTEYVISAPAVAKAARPGQFIILRVDNEGERVPFTICDSDPEAGTVSIVVQEVGVETRLLSQKEAGEGVADFVGPLGKATELAGFSNVLMIGGGIGAAVIFPQAKFLNGIGKPAEVILGTRTKELLIYEPEFLKNSKRLHIATDDGSYGQKGFVTDILKRLASSASYDCVFAVGPMPMMRAVCSVTKEFGIHTVVSLNPIMIDGTGMCGGCRVTVGGKTLYACVHGPEFDGHLVDWDEAISRNRAYTQQEKEHYCKLTGEKRS